MPLIPKTPKNRVRSPAYPLLNLESAVERAQTLYQNEGRNATHVDVALGHWGFERGSSNGMRAIAALLQFGLLADEGKKEDRQVQLTSLAFDILMPGDDPIRRKVALQTAALQPPLHKALWDKYEGSLPSDAALRRHLILERAFNEKAVGLFIRQFRATVAYADLPDDDTIEAEEGGIQDMPTPPANTPMIQPPTVNPAVGIGPYISFPLPGGNAVEIRLRSKVSKQDFDRIKQLVDLSEASLVESAPGPRDSS